MSPSEHELRAALSDGEGPGLNADLIIGKAAAYQRQRRARMLSVVSATAIVAGIGVGAGFLVNSSSSTSGSHSTNADKADRADRGDRGAVNGNVSAPIEAPAPPSSRAGVGGGGATAAAACPAKLPRVSTPKSASADSLFPSHVQAVVVCAYGSTVQATTAFAPASTSLTGSQATNLLKSLDDAATTRGGVCPDFRTARQPQQYVFFGIDETGTPSDPVVATVGDNPCQSVITNGKAVRYAWSPPSGLASILAGLRPSGASATLPSIGPTGTPIPSQSRS